MVSLFQNVYKHNQNKSDIFLPTIQGTMHFSFSSCILWILVVALDREDKKYDHDKIGWLKSENTRCNTEYSHVSHPM
jgi:hypothetical protein